MQPPRRVLALVLGTAVLLGLAATPATAAPGAARRDPSASEARFTGRVIVRYKPGVTRVAKRRIAQAARGRTAVRLAALNVEVLATGASSFTLRTLRDRPEVLWASREVLARRHAELTSTPERTELNPAGMLAANAAADGTGVKVGVIDDGVWRTPDLGFSGDTDQLGGVRLRDGGNCSTGVCGPTGGIDAHAGSHGTAVATIIAAKDNDRGIIGVAPDATVYSFRVFPSITAGASDPAIAAALLRAAQLNLDVVNLSLGTDFDSPLLRDAFATVRQSDPNMVIVAAAGNNGLERASYPAGLPGVLSVGASEFFGANNWPVAGFSTAGDVDVLAPGAGIRAWYRDDDGVPFEPTGSCGDSPLTCIDGTSFAAPQVAGVLAGLASTGVKGDRSRAAVVAAAEPASASSRPAAASGAGRADALTSLQRATGTAAYSAAFLDRGAFIARTSGRRNVEVIRVDPQPGTAPDGAAALVVPNPGLGADGTAALVGSPTSSTEGSVVVHRSRYRYTAPNAGAVDRTVLLQVGAAGDTARNVAIRIVPETNGPEGKRICETSCPTQFLGTEGAPILLTHGVHSQAIYRIRLLKGQRLQLDFQYAPESFASTLFVWLPDLVNGGYGASDAPFGAEESGAFSGRMLFTAPVTGDYAFGFVAFEQGDSGAYRLTATRLAYGWRALPNDTRRFTPR